MGVPEDSLLQRWGLGGEPSLFVRELGVSGVWRDMPVGLMQWWGKGSVVVLTFGILRGRGREQGAHGVGPLP